MFRTTHRLAIYCFALVCLLAATLFIQTPAHAAKTQNVTAFTIHCYPTQIMARWEIESERGVIGYNLYQSVNAVETGDQVNKNMLSATGGNEGENYKYTFRNFVPNVTYYFRLEVIDFTGGSRLYGPVAFTHNCGFIGK